MTFSLAFFLIASLLVILLDFAFVFLSARTFTICEENCVVVAHVLMYLLHDKYLSHRVLTLPPYLTCSSQSLPPDPRDE